MLFGGQCDKTTMLDDTWIWNGSSWAKSDVAGPSARSSAVMATITPAHVATPPAFIDFIPGPYLRPFDLGDDRRGRGNPW